MSKAGNKDGDDTVGVTAERGDATVRGRKSVSLAKTVRPNLLAVVQRRTLFDRLDQGAERGVIWVAGPPGAGKTTLVSSYLEHRRLIHLWYQVDRGDIDAATFFHYLGLAASREPSLSSSDLPTLPSARGDDVAAFSRNYFRELYRRLAPPFSLVFDNYQEAPLQSPLPLIINVALEEIPPSGSVIVISRSEPPRELARLRANQRIELIGWSELRLSPKELQSMARKRGQILTESAIRSLHQRTQGWAAGAVLMLEHAKIMGTEAEPPSDNTPQVIFDYVAGEIFDKFEAQSQAFLLSTACLTQMTAQMAETISGYSKAGPLLANLARNDYFVTERNADGETVYQFHRLLSAFLRTRARQTCALQEWAKLVRRSGALLAEAGQADDAISLLMDEGHWEEATELIVANASEILAQGRAETLAAWLDELPSSIATDNPWVLYWQAATRHSSTPRESRRLYERAYERFRRASSPDPEGMVLACCGSIDAIVRELDDLSLLDPWIDALQSQWSEYRRTLAEHVELSVSRSLLVSLLLRRAGLAEFQTWLEHALNLCRRHPHATLREALQPVAALALILTGRSSEAADFIEIAYAQAGDGGLPPGATAQLAYVDSLGRLLSGNIAAASDADGLRGPASPARGLTRGDCPSIHCAILHLNDGRLDEAEAVLGDLSAELASARRFERGMCYFLHAWLSMCRDDKVNAYQQAQTALGIARELGSPAFETLCRLAWAEALAACGELRRAESQLRHVDEVRRSIGIPLLEFMAGLSSARIALDAGKRVRALEALEESLRVGRRYGFTHTLWWRPAAMGELCALALSEGVEGDYVRHLIRSRSLEPDESAVDLHAWPWRFQLLTLGKFRLLKDGTTPIAIGKNSRRPLELLKVLVALGGRDVRVEHLSDILWPNVDGDYAYGSLTSTLHRLRRLLEVEDALILQDGRLSLNARYFWVDAWALERLFNEFEREPVASAGHESMMVRAERLLDLYRGAFLEDESESTCYIALREHFRGKMLRMLVRIASQSNDADHMESVTGFYERAIDADPLCEGLYRNLMGLYDSLERRAEALNVYERCRAVLTSALKVSPSAETVGLYERITQDGSVR